MVACVNPDSQIGACSEEVDATPEPHPVTAGAEPAAGAPSDLDLMLGIQAQDPDALSQLYDRYSGILKALILRVLHNDAEADDLLQEVFMEIWNQAKNFSSKRGKALGWMVTLARRRAIDALRKKKAYARAEERLQAETEQQQDIRHAECYGGQSAFRRHPGADGSSLTIPAGGATKNSGAGIFLRHEPARNRGKYEYTIRNRKNAA